MIAALTNTKSESGPVLCSHILHPVTQKLPVAIFTSLHLVHALNIVLICKR